MSEKSKVDTLREIIQRVADSHENFFVVKGPGLGDKDTNTFVGKVREQAMLAFEADYSEAKITGTAKLAVDYYFPDEATIVEIALGLKNPASEFEKDILKALCAMPQYPVKRLVFIAKPGAIKVCEGLGRKTFINWAYNTHQLTINIFEIENLQKLPNT